MSTTSLSSDNKIDALLSTYLWSSAQGTSASITYSFPENGSSWESNYGSGEPFSPNSWSSLTSTERLFFADALAVWADVANLSFSQTTDLSNKGDIRVAFTSAITGSVAGYAYSPPKLAYADMLATYSNGLSSYNLSGDIWLNQTLTDFGPNSQGFATFVHEIGHAIGFKHSFEADSTNSVVLTGAEDSTQYTVMSYTDYNGAGYTKDTATGKYYVTGPSTAMLYDIAAMQYLYGANMTTRTGDDTYTFSTVAELKTIWDAGGNDTFDLSNQQLGLTVDLNAGAFSSIGNMSYKLVSGFVEATSEIAQNNIAIAYNTEIENVIGGAGADTLTGNALANQFTGGAGNDTLIGGAGNDTAIYSSNQADYSLTKTASGVTIVSNNTTEGTDTLTDIEFIQFKDVLVDAATFATTTTNTTTAIPTTSSEVDTTPTEGNSNHINYFLLQINTALAVDASVTYQTQNGSAVAGSDYTATSGIATIKAGELSTVIAVEILADTIAESSETFSLLISNPTGASFPTGVTEIAVTRTIIDDDNAAARVLPEISLLGMTALEQVY